jgi:dipeptidyl-peptidase-4
MGLRSGSPRTQWVADQGFLVVKIVNRGETARLGRDFERAVKGDLAGPALEDQAEGLAELAALVPEIDLTRVGISGWSFGGYMAALAALKRPDLFRVAMAGAPVVEWSDYDTYYTERYLGLPGQAPEAYDRSSLTRLAGKDHAPLLLVHGTADDNVYLLHSLKLADALFRAGAPATFVPLANVTHLASDPSTAERLAEMEIQFFRETLGAPRP